MTQEEFYNTVKENKYDPQTVTAWELSRIASALEYFNNAYVERVVKGMKEQENANNTLRDNLNAFSESFKNAVNKSIGTDNKPDVEIVK